MKLDSDLLLQLESDGGPRETGCCPRPVAVGYLRTGPLPAPFAPTLADLTGGGDSAGRDGRLAFS